MEALALVGSKSGGTGLEKEQMGHIQVAFAVVAVESLDERKGLLVLETGNEEDPPVATALF